MDSGTTSVLAAATGVTLFGVVTGLSYEVLLAGFFGAIVWLTYQEAMPWGKRVWTLISSTLTAGYATPLLLGVLAKWMEMGKMPAGGAPLAGFLIGLGAQVGIPVFLSWIKRRGNAQDA